MREPYVFDVHLDPFAHIREDTEPAGVELTRTRDEGPHVTHTDVWAMSLDELRALWLVISAYLSTLAGE